MEVMEILAAIAVPTLGGAVAWGKIDQAVKAVAKELDTKATKEVVDVQYNSMIERLDRIERKLDRNTTSGG